MANTSNSSGSPAHYRRLCVVYCLLNVLWLAVLGLLLTSFPLHSSPPGACRPPPTQGLAPAVRAETAGVCLKKEELQQLVELHSTAVLLDTDQLPTPLTDGDGAGCLVWRAGSLPPGWLRLGEGGTVLEILQDGAFFLHAQVTFTAPCNRHDVTELSINKRARGKVQEGEVLFRSIVTAGSTCRPLCLLPGGEGEEEEGEGEGEEGEGEVRGVGGIQRLRKGDRLSVRVSRPGLVLPSSPRATFTLRYLDN